MQEGGLRDVFASWLVESWHWDWFFTGTFAPPVDEGVRTSVGWSASDRRYRKWVREVERLPGSRGKGSLYWVRVREPFQFSESTHFHALVGGVGTLRRTEAFWRWFERNGQGRIEPIRDLEECSKYVTKYLLKSDGEVVFSDNAGDYRGAGVLPLR